MKATEVPARALAGRSAALLLWLTTVPGVALWMLWSYPTSRAGVALAPAFAVLTYAGTRMVALIRAGETRLVEGAVWLFIYVAGGIAPSAQLITSLQPGLVESSLYAPALWLVLLTCPVLHAGFTLAWRSDPLRSRKVPTRAANARPLQGLNVQGLYWLSAGATVGSAWLVKTVGLGSLFASRQSLGAGLAAANDAGSQATSAMLVAVGQAPALVALCAATAMLRRSRLGQYRGVRVLWIWLLFLNVCVNNPVSNPRYWFAAVLVGILFAGLVPSTRRYQVFLLGGAVAAVVVFPVSDVSRYDAGGRTSRPSTTTLQTLATKDYDQVIMTANGLWYAERHGHTGGRQLAGSILFWVPRSMWPSKPLDTGVLVGQSSAVNRNVNVSSPIWLELWLDFSVPGMVLLLGAFAFAAGRMDALFHRGQDVHRPLVLSDVLVPILAGYTFILMRGPLLQAMSRLTALVVAGLALAGVSRLVPARSTAAALQTSASGKAQDAQRVLGRTLPS